MSEPLEFICPQCNVKVFVPLDQAGTKMDCPRCNQKITVPGIQSEINDPFSDIFGESNETLPEHNVLPDLPDSGAIGRDLAVEDDEDVEGADPVFSNPDETGNSDSLPNSDPASSTAPATSSASLGNTSSEGRTSLPVESTEPIPADRLPANESTPDGLNSEVDDLLSSITNFAQSPASQSVDFENSPVHANPFEEKPDPRIKLDGVSGNYGVDNISILCPVCESRVYARRVQAGSEIKCDDCYSLVKIPPLEQWQAATDNEASPKQKSSAELTFSAPESQPKDLTDDPLVPRINQDVDSDYGLAPVDNDLLAPQAHLPEPVVEPTEPLHPIESELFGYQLAPEATGPTASATPQSYPIEAIPVDPTASPERPGAAQPIHTDSEYELLPLDETPDRETASPAGTQPVMTPGASPARPPEPSSSTPLTEAYGLSPSENAGASVVQSASSAIEPATKLPNENRSVDANASDPDKPGGNERDNKSKNSKSGHDDWDLTKELQGWGGSLAASMQSLEGWLIVVVFAGTLAMGLGMITVGAHYLQSDNGPISMMAYFPWALGKFLWLLTFLAEGVILYNAMLTGIYQKKEAAEWPDLSASEIISQLMPVGFANIMSCLPGLLLAFLVTQAGVPILAPLVFFGSRLLIGPPMMMSAMDNQSFYKIGSPGIFQSVSTAGREWLIFGCLLGILGVFMIICESISLINFCLVSAIYGMIYAFFLLVYGTLVGHHFAQIKRRVGDTDMLGESKGS